MKAMGRMKVYFHVFLTWALRGGEQLNSCPSIHFRRSWMGFEVHLDDL